MNAQAPCAEGNRRGDLAQTATPFIPVALKGEWLPHNFCPSERQDRSKIKGQGKRHMSASIYRGGDNPKNRYRCLLQLAAAWRSLDIPNARRPPSGRQHKPVATRLFLPIGRQLAPCQPLRLRRGSYIFISHDWLMLRLGAPRPFPTGNRSGFQADRLQSNM
jgi:hypothetical protein